MMKRAILAIALAALLAGGAAQAQCKGKSDASCSKSKSCCQQTYQRPSIHDPANIWYRGPLPERTLGEWLECGGGHHRHHGREMRGECCMHGGRGSCMEGSERGRGMMPGCERRMMPGCGQRMMPGCEGGMMPNCEKGMKPGCCKEMNVRRIKIVRRGCEQNMMPNCEKGMKPGCCKGMKPGAGMMKPGCGKAAAPHCGQTPHTPPTPDQDTPPATPPSH